MNSTIIATLTSILLFLVYSCTNNEKTNKDIEEFLDKKITIPYGSMDVRLCSIFSDSIMSEDDIPPFLHFQVHQHPFLCA